MPSVTQGQGRLPMWPRSTLLLSLFFLPLAVCGVGAVLGSKGNQELQGPKALERQEGSLGLWDVLPTMAGTAGLKGLA